MKMRRTALVAILALVLLACWLLLPRPRPEPLPSAPPTVAPSLTPSVTSTAAPSSTSDASETPTVAPSETPTLTPSPTVQITPSAAGTEQPTFPAVTLEPPFTSTSTPPMPDLLPVSGGSGEGTPVSSTQLSALAGVLLSLLFSYVPGINERFQKLDSTGKRAIMGALIGVVGVIAFSASCAHFLLFDVSCDQSGLTGLAINIVFALMANQATYQISPQVLDAPKPVAVRPPPPPFPMPLSQTLAERDLVARVRPRAQVFFSLGTTRGLDPKLDCASAIITFFKNAQQSAHVCIFSLTHQPIVQAMIEAKQRGVEVIVLADQKQAAGVAMAAALKALSDAGVEVHLATKQHALMHNKCAIVDGSMVATGSFNWTNNAEHRNDENLIIVEGTDVAADYEKYVFRRIYNTEAMAQLAD